MYRQLLFFIVEISLQASDADSNINIITWFTFQLFRMKNITTLYIRSFAVQCEMMMQRISIEEFLWGICLIISHFTAKDYLKKGPRLGIIVVGGGGGWTRKKYICYFWRQINWVFKFSISFTTKCKYIKWYIKIPNW